MLSLWNDHHFTAQEELAVRGRTVVNYTALLFAQTVLLAVSSQEVLYKLISMTQYECVSSVLRSLQCDPFDD